MLLSQEGVLLLGAVISLAISFIIMVVVHNRYLRKIEKSHEEFEDGIPELIVDFSEPNSFELWVESLLFGLEVGFVIFLIFWFFSCTVSAN